MFKSRFKGAYLQQFPCPRDSSIWRSDNGDHKSILSAAILLSHLYGCVNIIQGKYCMICYVYVVCSKWCGHSGNTHLLSPGLWIFFFSCCCFMFWCLSPVHLLFLCFFITAALYISPHGIIAASDESSQSIFPSYFRRENKLVLFNWPVKKKWSKTIDNPYENSPRKKTGLVSDCFLCLCIFSLSKCKTKRMKTKHKCFWGSIFKLTHKMCFLSAFCQERVHFTSWSCFFFPGKTPELGNPWKLVKTGPIIRCTHGKSNSTIQSSCFLPLSEKRVQEPLNSVTLLPWVGSEKAVSQRLAPGSLSVSPRLSRLHRIVFFFIVRFKLLWVMLCSVMLRNNLAAFTNVLSGIHALSCTNNLVSENSCRCNFFIYFYSDNPLFFQNTHVLIDYFF